jgi:hypothetical protein
LADDCAGLSSSGIAGSIPAVRDTTTGSVGNDENGDGGGRTNVESNPLNGGMGYMEGGITSVSYEGSNLLLKGFVKPKDDRREIRGLRLIDLFNGEFGDRRGVAGFSLFFACPGDNGGDAMAGVGGKSANIMSTSHCRFSSRN